jgi:hypothetical protein
MIPQFCHSITILDGRPQRDNLAHAVIENSITWYESSTNWSMSQTTYLGSEGVDEHNLRLPLIVTTNKKSSRAENKKREF